MKDGFFRVAAASPLVTVADTEANAEHILKIIDDVRERDADAVVFPEMCITAYTCADLFHSETLLKNALRALRQITEHTADTEDMLVIVGAPLRVGNAVYNCAFAIANGMVLGIVPKTYIPNYNEFYEKRWFAPAPANGLPSHADLWDGAEQIPFVAGATGVFAGVRIGIEICEDLWTPIPPSCAMALDGAEIIFNLSASDDLIGKRAYTADLIRQQSARCICGYVYASAGFGESSTDLVFDAKQFIAEHGRMLSSNKPWTSGDTYIIADIDIEAIRRDRLHNTSFDDCRAKQDKLPLQLFAKDPASFLRSPRHPFDDTLLRDIDPHPFVPSSAEHLKERCEEIINIQVAGLAQRLNATRCGKLVVGISGGLDSTLALLVATRTFDRLGLDRSGITGVTMPGFGTTDRTHGNALTLMRSLGVSMREISIAAAVNQHFADIEHDPTVHDVTYENSQARERTQILMDVANQVGGMVLGTGDLSELALGWATYNGDHMSMYGVNAGVPKTLVRHLTRYFADITENADERAALLDIIDTPISPELIPAEPDGTIKQKTEDLVGPYELHDFFLYYTLRYGFSPKRIFMLALNAFAFAGAYDRDTILRWERTFFRRFFNQQFKRSALPDGPKVGSVCLSPRGDWRMPSDASSSLWLKELEDLQ